MALDTVESELAHVSVETGLEGNSSLSPKENGKLNKKLTTDEHITFGTHGTDEPKKKEVNTLPESSFPKDAVDEWPEPKQVHNFYIVRYRAYEDQKMKVKLDQADKEVKRLNQARLEILEKLKAQRADRAQVIGKLRSIGVEKKQYSQIIDEKKKELEPLQQALGKFRSSNTWNRERSLCSSEEELNEVIKTLQYRMVHETITLTEEKQLIKKIKQLEGTRDKVMANDAVRAKMQESLGEKEALQDQVKLIDVDLDGFRKEKDVVNAKIKQLEGEKFPIEKVIADLEAELDSVTEKRNKAYDKVKELRKQSDEGNASYYQNRAILTKAKELSLKKDVEALKDSVDAEVDKFISLWSSNKAFRDDYERRILPALDARQMSRDGRLRNPDEKPLVVHEPLISSETEKAAKPNLKQTKEDSVTNVVKKEKDTKQKEAVNNVSSSESTLVQSEEKVADKKSGSEKLEVSPKKNELDEAKLKELKREEEMAKAKQALERKKKLAEKTAAKAAIKAQKEAEKKLKEREKKAKKKASASASAAPEEPTEAAVEVAEPEKEEDASVQAAVPSKTKERKEKAVRQRGGTKGSDPLPKVILKKKKPTKYWVWAAPAALLIAMLSVIVYYYLV